VTQVYSISEVGLCESNNSFEPLCSLTDAGHCEDLVPDQGILLHPHSCFDRPA